MKLGRFFRSAAFLLAFAHGSAAGVRAAEMSVDALGLAEDELVARVRLVELLDAKTRNSVASGLPVTVRFTTELRRERRRWFDSRVDARVESYRIRWDPRERLYTLTYPGEELVEYYEGLSELLEVLELRELTVHDGSALRPGARYFAKIEVAVQPLTLAEFRELDGWIGGSIRAVDEPAWDAPEPAEDGLAGAMLGFLLEISGFGDEVLEKRTDVFQPADLRPLALAARLSGAH